MQRTDRTAPAAAGPVLAFAVGDESYGVLRGWEGVVRELLRRGVPFRFALVARDGALSRAVVAIGADTAFAPWGAMPSIAHRGIAKAAGLARRFAVQLRLLRWLDRLVAAHGAKAILVTSPLEVLVAGLVARRNAITAYWMMPNAISADYPADLNRRVYRFAFRHLNVVPLANSHYTDATLGPGGFRRQVVHLGIDPAGFDPARAAVAASAGGIDRSALGLPAEGVVIGVFARMVREKGQAVLIEALARLGDRARNTHLLLCGGPMDEFAQRLRAQARANGLAARIHLPGPIDAGDLAAHYALCDIIANPRLDPEPFGLSIIEAALMERPVLAHGAGGPGETVIDGVTGWLMPRPTADVYAAGLARALDDRPRWAAMGRAARAHALAHYTDARMADRLLAAMFG